MSGLVRLFVLAAFVWQQGACCDGRPCCADDEPATHRDALESDHDDHDSHDAPHHLCVATHLVYVRGETPIVDVGMTPAAAVALFDATAPVDEGAWPRPRAAADHRTRSQGRSLLAVYRL